MAQHAAALVRATFKPLVATSRLRLGPLDTRGTASILLGASAIVLAYGATSALARATTALPESLREARLFWLTVRAPRAEIAPTADAR